MKTPSLSCSSWPSASRTGPRLTRIREVAAAVASAVAEVAYEHDLATKPRPEDILGAIKAQMYEPQYRSYV